MCEHKHPHYQPLQYQLWVARVTQGVERLRKNIFLNPAVISYNTNVQRNTEMALKSSAGSLPDHLSYLHTARLCTAAHIKKILVECAEIY